MPRKLLLVAAFGTAGLLAACSPRAPAPRPSPSRSTSHRAHGPWLHITGKGSARQPVRWVWKAGNRVQYDLIARSYESSGAQGSAVTTFFDAHVTFYGKRGGRLFADAAQAVVDEATNTITLSGNVRSRTGSGMTLDCDTLRYDRSTQRIHGRGHVVITDPHGMRATGNSVDADLALSRARMQ